MGLKMTNLKSQLHLPGTNELPTYGKHISFDILFPWGAAQQTKNSLQMPSGKPTETHHLFCIDNWMVWL